MKEKHACFYASGYRGGTCHAVFGMVLIHRLDIET